MAQGQGSGKKGARATFTPEPMTKMSRAEADQAMDRFFHELQEELKEVPKGLVQMGAQRVVDFLKGDLTWGDIFNIPIAVQQRIAEFGYAQFQTGRYEEAERFFKILTILNTQNSYYHSMMGSILQRQKRDDEAIMSYTQAIDLNPNDIVSLTNRGEIYFRHGWFEQAADDFDGAIALDPKRENKWGNQARRLKAQITIAQQRRKGQEKPSPKAH